MSLRNNYKMDPVKEINGAFFSTGFNSDGTESGLFISRMSKSNPAYTKALQAATNPFTRQLQMKILSAEKQDALMKEVVIDVVVKGWQNIPLSDVTGNDKDVGYADFNKDNLRKLFDNLPELYQYAYDFGDTASNYKELELQANAKN